MPPLSWYVPVFSRVSYVCPANVNLESEMRSIFYILGSLCSLGSLRGYSSVKEGVSRLYETNLPFYLIVISFVCCSKSALEFEPSGIGFPSAFKHAHHASACTRIAIFKKAAFCWWLMDGNIHLKIMTPVVKRYPSQRNQVLEPASFILTAFRSRWVVTV